MRAQLAAVNSFADTARPSTHATPRAPLRVRLMGVSPRLGAASNKCRGASRRRAARPVSAWSGPCARHDPRADRASDRATRCLGSAGVLWLACGRLKYLRTFPREERAAALKQWRLGDAGSAARKPFTHVPHTEDWPAVFERIKEFVAESLGHHHQDKAAAAAESDLADETAATPRTDSAVATTAEEEARRLQWQERRQERQLEAEQAAWRHFEHRAAVSLPSFRQLRRADMGLVPLPEIRRARVDMGQLLPAWVGDGLAGIVMVLVAACCQIAVEMAMRVGGQSRAPWG